MSDRDEINALYLNLMAILNALEKHGEDITLHTGDNTIKGENGAVYWNYNEQQWTVERP